MAGNHSGHMVTEFENAFQSCLAALTNEDHFNVHDTEETKAGVDQTVARFLDMAKQMECFFLQKRLLLSAQKPEQIVREDISDLKNELNRKEQLILKHYEKIQFWQSLLSNLQGPGPRPPASASQSSPPPPPPPPPSQMPMGAMSPAMTPSPMGAVPSPMAMMHSTMPQVGPSGLPASVVSPLHTSGYGPPPPPSVAAGPPTSTGQMPSPMGAGTGGIGLHPMMHGSGLQGPLAYLEKTTSNIGMSEPR